MGQSLTLTASDGFKLGAYRADPEGKPRGGVVVVQEIFGVNHHIRAVCDRLAAAGWSAVAPAVFDRMTPGFECGYSPEEIEKARKFIPQLDWDKVMLDTAAAVEPLRPTGPLAVVGFCLGGSVAYLAATRLDGLSAAIGYYGGAIVRHADNKPRCPTQLHFGETDTGIPMADVETIRKKRPDVEVHTYPAGHGFGCDERASFHAASALMAWSRTLGWLDRHMK